MGSWKLSAKFSKPINKDSSEFVEISLNIYLDENWESALDQENCEDKLIGSKSEFKIDVPKNGEFSREYIGTLSQKVRPHVWFFTASD